MAVLVPIAALGVFGAGLSGGWWGSGVGDGWQYALAFVIAAGIVSAAVGVALRALLTRERNGPRPKRGWRNSRES